MSLRQLWRTANTPDDFVGNPFGGLLNQIGHSAISAWAFLVACCTWFAIAGEMPSRWLAAGILVALYVGAIEARTQGWRGVDSLIDAGFVAIGPALIAATAVEVASDGWVSVVHLRVDWLLIALLSLAAAWLAYALTRFRREVTTAYPTATFRLVEVDHPTEGGWEAHQLFKDRAGNTEWRPLQIWTGDIGCFYATQRVPSFRRADAEQAIRSARAELTLAQIRECET